jgi:hypothetical protein
MIAGKLVAFRGENEYADSDVLVEVVDLVGGVVEIGFDGPGKGIRSYLKVDLGQLVAEALKFATTE